MARRADALPGVRALVERSPARRGLVAAVVALAHEHRRRVMAEGIERMDKHEALRELGVYLGQGFFLGQPTERPVSTDAWLSAGGQPYPRPDGRSPDPELTSCVTALEDARARIIAAADHQRRRLERDLHDGAQQRLVAVSLTLGMARRRVAKGEDASDLLARADADAKAAIGELRDLARGIHPAILTHRGLAAAIEDLAARAPLPVEVAGVPEGRLPEPVEAAAYFTVAESLTNVAKYAHATYARVDAVAAGGVLRLEATDDGVGGASADGARASAA